MPRTFVWHRSRGPQKTEPNTLTTGKVRITQVSPKESVGQFVSKDGPTAKGDALPKVGDTVMKIN